MALTNFSVYGTLGDLCETPSRRLKPPPRPTVGLLGPTALYTQIKHELGEDEAMMILTDHGFMSLNHVCVTSDYARHGVVSALIAKGRELGLLRSYGNQWT